LQLVAAADIAPAYHHRDLGEISGPLRGGRAQRGFPLRLLRQRGLHEHRHSAELLCAVIFTHRFRASHNGALDGYGYSGFISMVTSAGRPEAF
jgi:hypothetical protein